jgi:ABC-2 type transport system permease protein
MRLIKNELIKEINIYKILGALLIFFLVSFTIIRYNYRGQSIPIYRNVLSTAENQLSKLKGEYNSNKTIDNLKKVYIQELNVELEQAVDNKHLLYDSWEVSVISSLTDNHGDITSLKLIKEGIDSAAFSGGSKYILYNANDIEDEYTKLMNYRNQLLDIISNKQYYEYVEYQINDIQKKINNIEEDTTDENINQSLIDYNNELINIKQYIVNQKITTNHDIVSINASILESLAIEKYLGEYQIINEDDYNINYDLKRTYRSYDNYKKVANDAKNKIDEDIEKTWYAMEHRISLSNRTKDIVNGFFSLFLLVTISVIVMFGEIISMEYKSGTIKLLLTKGVKRSKIILSKYTSVIISTNVLILLFFLIYIGITLWYYDFNDLLIPELVSLNGHIIELNYFIYLFIQILIASLPCLFFITMSLFLSSFMTNGIISSSISVFLATLYAIFNPFFMDTVLKFNLYFLKYTPVPYLNISPWFGVDDSYNIWVSFFDFKLGIIILLLSIIFMYLCTHIIFIKKDVRS